MECELEGCRRPPPEEAPAAAGVRGRTERAGAEGPSALADVGIRLPAEHAGGMPPGNSEVPFGVARQSESPIDCVFWMHREEILPGDGSKAIHLRMDFA